MKESIRIKRSRLIIGLLNSIAYLVYNIHLLRLKHNKNFIETINLSQNKEYKETLIKGLREDVNSGENEEEVNWSDICKIIVSKKQIKIFHFTIPIT